MSEKSDQIEAIVLRAHRARKSIKAICDRAGVAPSTWSRWRAGEVEPNQSTIDELNKALDQLESA